MGTLREPVPWRRKFVLTQGNVAATDITLRLAVRASCMMTIDVLTTGPDDYAVGGRTILARIINATTGNVIETCGSLAGVDNQTVHWGPRTDAASAAANVARRAGGGWDVYGGDTLEISVSSAAQNETLTVFLRAKATGILSASSLNAGVTLAETEA